MTDILKFEKAVCMECNWEGFPEDVLTEYERHYTKSGHNYFLDDIKKCPECNSNFIELE